MDGEERLLPEREPLNFTGAHDTAIIPAEVHLVPGYP